MILYRITLSKFRDDISGHGAALYGGRWNSKGNAVLYCAEHISLAVLELVVNFDQSFSPLIPSYHILEIELPIGNDLMIELPKLKRKWDDDQPYTQFIGDQFLLDNKYLAMKVPSAVVHEENNYLINPNHQAFKKVIIKKSRVYQPDTRLLIK